MPRPPTCFTEFVTARYRSAWWRDCLQQGISISALVSAIDLKRYHSNLSSALRLFTLDFYRKRLPPLE
jgi:hypothetical protein